MITSELSHFHPALPSRNLTPGAHSNPIGPRPPRQRLPPSLLIENASDPVSRPCHLSCPRRFRSRLATTRQSGLLPCSRRTANWSENRNSEPYSSICPGGSKPPKNTLLGGLEPPGQILE